jgi:hypothetical protein
MPVHERRTLRVLIALGSASVAGCSVLAVAGPPANAASYDYVHCTRSEAAPVVDLLAAAGSGISGAALAANGKNAAPAAIFGVIALAYGASAGYGLITVARCADAQHEAAARRRAVGAVQVTPAASEEATR